jgi:proline iminopeptidase
MSEEGYVDVPGGRVWYKSLGEGGVPLLCLHGGPGFTHNYLEPLKALSGRRRVVFYDQLGCGKSDRPDDNSLWTIDRFVEEVATVRAALGLERTHLFGSSWGGMLAMQYVLDRKPDLVSLIMAGSPASMPRWARDCAEMLKAFPAEVQQSIRAHEAAGTTACPEYGAAILPFYKRHVCRLEPWPAGLERSFAEAGYQVYNYMNGPSEFTITGTFKNWDILDRLGEIRVPTLITGGELDECHPDHLREIHRRIPGSELRIIEGAAHLCFAEKPEEYMAVANEFMERVERAAAA